jgi:DNA-binding transcriptional LysR family regulator
MDTDLLRTFIEVSKTRHFGRAAENLYLTQSAVSFRIRQLEQQLGVSLFARHRNNIQLTQSGEHLLPYAAWHRLWPRFVSRGLKSAK